MAALKFPDQFLEALREFANGRKTGRVTGTFHFSQGSLEIVDVDRDERVRMGRPERSVASQNGNLLTPATR